MASMMESRPVRELQTWIIRPSALPERPESAQGILVTGRRDAAITTKEWDLITRIGARRDNQGMIKPERTCRALFISSKNRRQGTCH